MKSLLYKGPVESAAAPIDQELWNDAFRYGSESDTGENSRQYLQDRLFMSYREFEESLKDQSLNESQSKSRQ